MKRIAAWLGAGVVLLIAVMVARTVGFRSRQVAVAEVTDLAVDGDAAARRLSRAVQFQTVSRQDSAGGVTAPEAFVGLRAFLSGAFPLVHAQLPREVVADHALLYTWKGSDPQLAPVVLMGHMDVVPVEPGTEAAWTEPPFSGHIKDGLVWGRGTLDDKGGVLSILEAAELLLARGHKPRRTIYLAFGHDEEVLGTGAQKIAELLRQRGVRPEFVLDEGLVITQGMMPGIAGPVAVIGMSEKGYLTLELVVRGEGGHSSMPPAHTAAGVLAGAIVRLEDRPMPAEVRGLARQMFDYVGPEMALPLRLVFANLWLTSPLVRGILLGKPSTAALLRTTTAVTQLQGSIKENVLPSVARAVVNFRIVPGDTVEGVVAHVKRVVGDPRVEVQALHPGNEAVRPAPVDAPSFAVLQRSIRQVAPDAVVAPSLMVGATDSRHYQGMTESIYRFRPVLYRSEDLSRLHGTNERVPIADHVRCIRFYAQLIRNVD